jgi:glucan phosphoethanolaminetransferase (alkaline phosphatase superfamily)
MASTLTSRLGNPWRIKPLLADIVLLALVFGPPAAPFLRVSGLFPLTTIADIIYTMGEAVCPQPEMGVALAGSAQMAVCMRCYGTVLGLVLMRWLFRRDRGRSGYWLEQYGLWGFALTFVICMAYPLELALQKTSWWAMSHWIMTGFGLVAGLGLGAYVMPVFHSDDRLST